MITIIAPDYSRDGLFIMSHDRGKQMRNSHKKSYSELDYSKCHSSFLHHIVLEMASDGTQTRFPV
jgi:hypothetical protein